MPKRGESDMTDIRRTRLVIVGQGRDTTPSAGATRAQLLMDTENAPAEAFYAQLGWQKTGLAARRIPLK